MKWTLSRGALAAASALLMSGCTPPPPPPGVTGSTAESTFEPPAFEPASTAVAPAATPAATAEVTPAAPAETTPETTPAATPAATVPAEMPAKPEAPATTPELPDPAPETKPTEPAKPESPAPEAKPETPAPSTTEAKPAETKPAEAKPDEAKPDEAKPAEAVKTDAPAVAMKPAAPAAPAPVDVKEERTKEVLVDTSLRVEVGPKDWPMWGGSNLRNNVPQNAKDIPIEWDPESGKNILWVSSLGSQTYGNPVVANGQVYVGSNNGAGYLSRYARQIDLGTLLAFKESNGEFLWQHSSEKLPTGRVHDWPLQGICCASLLEGDKVYFVTSRGEVRCLDAKGFHDGENDGPYKDEKNENKDEADVLWVFDMMETLGVSQHNMCSCSLISAGDVLFVTTANGVDESHINIPAPQAPSFMALDKKTGKVLWTDGSPGLNILHGQWSSPTYAVLGGVPQVIFGAGDGFLYSFDPLGENGQAKHLWRFDTNPKESRWILGGRGTRNDPIGTPVIYKGLVYVAIGQDPEHGEGQGHLWCIDPTKRGDVSPQIVYNAKDGFKEPVPHKRLQACEPELGDVARDNPNSAAIWHYDAVDSDGDGEKSFEETMHRTCGTVAIKDDILYVADFSGLFHCVDAKTGKPYWTYDMLAACWSSPLIVDGHVYIGDEDGDIAIFNHSKDKTAAEPIAEINMGNAVYTTPIVANDTLFIANKSALFAIQNGAELKPENKRLRKVTEDGDSE